MRKAIKRVQELRCGSVNKLVEQRKREFKGMRKKDSSELFKELCFCILTANYTAEGGLLIQKEVGDGFLTLSEKQLAVRLKKLGHRFPNTRAKYIAEARKHAAGLKKKLSSFSSSTDARSWLVKNVKGLGMKEASHLLRNIGHDDVAIVDFHIVDFLVDCGVVERPKTMTPRRYAEIEEKLKRIGKCAGMSMAELDLYMWYCETGKVLK
ncbi:N-glycosylase/DNA lyase [Candidatus Woesearchaeota archaeon]|nr:N-glycosylase/DNA lyase [Candidatus Woesearchaeota archaeon]